MLGQGHNAVTFLPRLTRYPGVGRRPRLIPGVRRQSNLVEEAIMDTDAERRGLEWQVGVWDRISELYLREVDPRFATVVEGVVRRGDLKSGQRVLDLGTGTGSVAVAAASRVGPAGKVTAVD